MPPESDADSHRITRLLRAWGQGDDAALAELTPLVHAELRRVARGYMKDERPDHRSRPPPSSTSASCD